MSEEKGGHAAQVRMRAQLTSAEGSLHAGTVLMSSHRRTY